MSESIVAHFVWTEFNGQLSCSKVASDMWRAAQDKTSDGFTWRNPQIVAMYPLTTALFALSLDDLAAKYPPPIRPVD